MLSTILTVLAGLGTGILGGWALSAAFLAQTDGFFGNEGYRWFSFLLASGIFIKIVPDEYSLRNAVPLFLCAVLIVGLGRYLIKRSADS